MFDQVTPQDPKRAREFFEAKMSFTTGPAEVKAMIDRGSEVNIIDVRAAKDYAQGHVPCALNLPKDQWDTLKGLSKDKTNIIYCYSAVCHLAANAALEFASKGFPVMEMDGGMKAWRAHDYEIETADTSKTFQTRGRNAVHP
jgi:rhodanese-related sulfurtransferase